MAECRWKIGGDCSYSRFPDSYEYVGQIAEIHLVLADAPAGPPADVPEPGSIALLAAGIVGIGALRRRKLA